MPVLQQENYLGPVTALAFAPGASAFLLLAGNGTTLKIYDTSESHQIGSQRLFLSQAIQGISCQEHQPDVFDQSSRFRCLVWGGRSFIVIELHIFREDASFNVKCEPITRECFTLDRILHGQLSPKQWWTNGSGRPFVQAAIVSAHNELSSIHLSRVFESDIQLSTSIETLYQCPSSILYSAHIFWQTSGRDIHKIFVAAGTAFGEVLLWSCPIFQNKRENHQSGVANLLKCFIGHEGSIFGVHISTPTSRRAVPSGTRDLIHPFDFLLTSCSDDRTIKIWNVTSALTAEAHGIPLETVTEGRFNQISSISEDRPIAAAMGHLSRIWCVRAVPYTKKAAHIFSFGEDSVAQHWNLSTASTNVDDPPISLSPGKCFAFHTGKHLWAADVKLLVDGKCLMSTGGADGRIVIHTVNNRSDTTRWTSDTTALKESLAKTQMEIESFNSHAMSTKEIFHSMAGSWDLHRDIESRVKWYPSGVFKGTATLIKRPPSEEGYDGELVYHEKGNFHTDQGLVLEGSRSYVYRYQNASNSITAWFVKVDNASEVDYLFHKVAFDQEQNETHELSVGPATASGHHLCIRDDYNAEYAFDYSKRSMDSWLLKYLVRGPEKDYTSSAKYIRISSSEREHEKSSFDMGMQEPTSQHDIGMQESLFKHDTAFKAYCWLEDELILATASKGRVLLGMLIDTKSSLRPVTLNTGVMEAEGISWNLIGKLKDLESFGLVERVPGYGAVLGGESGVIYGYPSRTSTLETIGRVPHKPIGLFATKLLLDDRVCHAVLVACSRSRYAYVMPIVNGLDVSAAETSVCFLSSIDLFVLGSRKGTVCVFKNPSKTDEGGPEPLAIIPCIHGEEAITSIQELEDGERVSREVHLLTTGRDGQVLISSFHLPSPEEPKITLHKVHSMTPPLGAYIEGAFVHPLTKNILAWGFRSKFFVVYNCSNQKEVMEVDCGGAHRSWAYFPSICNGKEGGGLVWTKASVCHVLVQPQSSHQVLQCGSQGREIKAIAMQAHLDSTEKLLLATGSEDTTIQISEYCAKSPSRLKTFHISCVARKHVTGIQQLRWSPDGRYLFSAGGREEFFVWQVQSVPIVGIGVICIARCPAVTSSSDLRIMDFDILPFTTPDSATRSFLISMVYSDSSVRCWVFGHSHPTAGEFTLISIGTYTSNCLTTAVHFHLDSNPYIATGSTDGHIAIWPLSPPAQIAQNDSTPRPTMKPLLRHCVHQNSIKSLSLRTLSESSLLLATGGDDNALSVTLLASPALGTTPRSVPTCYTTSIPRAHAASITGVAWSPSAPPPSPPSSSARPSSEHARRQTHMLLSTSNDQRLRAWHVTVPVPQVRAGPADGPRGEHGRFEGEEDAGPSGGLEVRKAGSWDSEVADAACLDVAGVLGVMKAVIAGVGLEVWGAGGGQNSS